MRIQWWGKANRLIWCLPAAQVRGQVPPLNHRLSELLWTWRWSTSPSCGKCLRTRLQPGPRDSNCFFCLPGLDGTYQVTLSPSCQASPPWLSPSPLAPRLRLIWSSLHRRNSRPYARVYISRRRLPWTRPLYSHRVMDFLQPGGGPYFDTSHFLFHESHLRALGWTEVMNEWANDPLKTGQRVERRFQRGKTFPSLLQWQITLSHYAESGSLNAAAEVHRSGFSLWVNTVIQTVFSANSSHLHLYFL